VLRRLPVDGSGGGTVDVSKIDMGVQGGIIEREAPLHVSNVLIFNPATQKGDRVGFKSLENGRKVRIFKSNKEMIDAK